MNLTDLSAPNPSRQTWKFDTLAGTDLAVIAQALQSLGCDFNSEGDQLGQSQDTGAYALSGQR